MTHHFSRPFSDWAAENGLEHDRPFEVDAVVIGSGYGGSVAALRLAQEGRKVLVLERGAEFQPGDFPNHLGQLPKFVRAHGLGGTMGSLGGVMDLRLGLGMAAVTGNGLGGGSLVNAGVMMKPDEDVFAQQAWPAPIRQRLDERFAAGTQPLGLEDAFALAAQQLRGETFDDRVHPGRPSFVPIASEPAGVSQLPKAQTLKRMGEALRAKLAKGSPTNPDRALDFEARPAQLTIDLKNCSRCGDCFSGCNVPSAKRTLLTSYLKDAYEHHAELLTSSLVYTLHPDGGRWMIRVLPSESERNALKLKDAVALEGYTLSAALVVVAAGTFGSTELLQRSQENCTDFQLSPALGTRLSGNGDSISAHADLDPKVGGVGHGAECIEADDVGPTITTILDLRRRRELDQRIVLQEGAVPGALGRIYAEILATTWTLKNLGTLGPRPKANAGKEPFAASRDLAEHTQLLLAMGHDGSKGRVVWLPQMDGAVPYWENPDEAETYKRQQQLFDAAESGGGVHLHPPTWHFVDPELARIADGKLPPATIFTVHPLGGCPMGDSFEQGVVDHLGRAWKAPHTLWDNLYVLDGSIVPTSLGCNPLWTITALAERAMAHRGVPPVQGRRLRQLPWWPPARAPLAIRRKEPPPIHMDVVERLELRELKLHGALRKALHADKVEADIELSMASTDWFAVWDDPRHRIPQVTGTLRLVVPPPSKADMALLESTELPRLVYKVRTGHIELFSPDAAGWRFPRRALRLPLVLLTWALLRGQRDWKESREPRRPTHAPSPLRALFGLWWTATEVRYVDYDLELAFQPQAGSAVRGPRTLWLAGGKVVRYHASIWEIVTHLCARLFTRDRRPGDLRASLLHQLTQPRLRLDTNIWKRWLPWCGDASARFAFDAQRAMQRSPVRVHGGGDSTTAALAAVTYPAFLLRYLLQTRLLDFRLPTYSDQPVIDNASDEDVKLRTKRGPVLPQEYDLCVPVGYSSSDDGTEPDPASSLHLRLWRYRQLDEAGIARNPDWQSGTWCEQPVRRVKSVLLMHAFDMSGYSFTLKSVAPGQNFAEHLHDQGWEVWILDSRMSPRSSASSEPCTVDQLGFIDAPRAVDFILEQLREELKGEPDQSPLQIHGFGQCMGAASFLVGLLGGRLSHDVEAPRAYASTTGIRPRMPKLAALVTSQTHPFIVGSRTAQAKTWMPALLRDLAGRTMVPLGVREPVTSVVDTLADRLFAGLPVPDGERCHDEGEVDRIDDDCATCRRVRFLLGGMFLHRNLLRETHQELPKLFGAGSVRLFAHGAKFFMYERLCSEDGHNVYATDEAMSRYLALPLRFMHGEFNDLFDKESATRSAEQFRRVHPGWAIRYGHFDRESGVKQACEVIQGFGHVDVLIGKDGAAHARLSELLRQAWDIRDAAPELGAPLPERVVVRFPRSGPFLGPPVIDARGRRHVPVSFIVDDGNADTPSDAVALVDYPGVPTSLVPLQVRPIHVAVPARDGQFAPPVEDPLVGLRVACGQVPIPPEADGVDGAALSIRCVAYARTTAEPMRKIALPSFVQRRWDLQPVEGSAVLANGQVTLGDLEAAIADAQQQVVDLRAASDRPFPRTLSQKLRLPRHETTMRALVPAQVLAEPTPEQVVHVAVGCCRYGGFPFERSRVDDALEGLIDRLKSDLPAKRPQALFLLGDQIYADRTAGLIDPQSPSERYFSRHQEAFTSYAARRLFSVLPTVCVPDDHEFVDSYPLGRPLVRHGPAGSAAASDWRAREDAAFDIAKKALTAYQFGQLPASMERDGYFAFRRGRVHFFVLDTRVHRKVRDGHVRTTTARARAAFRHWAKTLAPGEIGCLVTGSVVVPGLQHGADPANLGPVDTMQAAPRERLWLLMMLARHLRHRFVLLSGDYHVSFAGHVCMDGERIGAAIVAPPVYAPLIYANAKPQDLEIPEDIELLDGRHMTICPVGPGAVSGSGLGTLSFEPAGDGWRVRLRADLIDFEQDLQANEVAWPAIELVAGAGHPQAAPTAVDDPQSVPAD